MREDPSHVYHGEHTIIMNSKAVDQSLGAFSAGILFDFINKLTSINRVHDRYFINDSVSLPINCFRGEKGSREERRGEAY